MVYIVKTLRALQLLHGFQEAGAWKIRPGTGAKPVIHHYLTH